MVCHKIDEALFHLNEMVYNKMCEVVGTSSSVPNIVQQVYATRKNKYIQPL